MERPLNWREISTFVDWVRPEISGMFVDRIVVPTRAEFPDGFLKNEWSLRLTSRSGEAALLFSSRPRQPYLDWKEGKGPKASPHATRSGFDLTLNKLLEGRRVLGFEAVERERSAVVWVEGADTHSVYGLVFTLIPALPESLLVEVPKDGIPANALEKGKLAQFLAGRRLAVLARSRGIETSVYEFPDGSRSPMELELRAGDFKDLDSYRRFIREALDEEAFALRLQRIRTRVNQDLKLNRTRLAQNQRTLKEALAEADYRHAGDLLKSVMGTPPPLAGSKRRVFDWTTEQEVELECDPKLSVRDQVEKFYSLAKRKERRWKEAELRMATFAEKVAALESVLAEADRIALSKLRGRAKIDELVPVEGKLGLSVGAPENAERKSLAGAGKKSGWSGKTFISKEGLPILVGRSKDENLELTFKFARGNDLWMHVRGKPGAHLVVPIRSKKSASLSTLLDAAYLCLHYSGGVEWGKTEIDYTFKKYVKRIRDSSEASYTNNKTLMVEIDKVRLKELLSQENL